MADHFKSIGLKFYQFTDDSPIPKILRLTQFDEIKKEYTLYDSLTGNMVIIPSDELENKWIKLNPDGIVVFSCCTALDNQGDEVPDLMVNLHRVDSHTGAIEKIPFCSCRQAVIDIFALLQNSARYIAGMSISQESCPPELDFRSCLSYDKMTKSVLVFVYSDDHLDDILKLFKHRAFEQRLELIKSRDKMGIPGYQTNLYDFLHENYFMYDFHRAFNIHELSLDTFDFEDQTTNRVVTDYIISNTQEVPIKLYPIPFSKYIDLKDIKRKYILLCPDSYKYPNGNITLVGYDISQTISYKDLVNHGKSPKDAKKEIMASLGWS